MEIKKLIIKTGYIITRFISLSRFLNKAYKKNGTETIENTDNNGSFK